MKEFPTTEVVSVTSVVRVSVDLAVPAVRLTGVSMMALEDNL
jgi:hypothetical protein